MANTDVEALRVQGLLRPLSVQQPFWLFDGKSLSDEVDHLARRCRTDSPNALQQDLYHEAKPRSLPGIPLESGSHIKWKTLRFRSRIQSTNSQNSTKDDGFKKLLQKFQPPETREMTLCPGYVMLQGKNGLTATIKPAEFFDPKSFEDPPKERRRSNVMSEETRLLIEELDKLVDDLTASLEEEKFNHKENIRHMSVDHKDELEQINEEHVAHIKAIEADHFKALKKLEDSHRLIVKTIREEAMKENAALSRELKESRTLFDTQREAFAKEIMAEWEEREVEVRLECDRKAEKLLLDQKNEMRSQKNTQLDKINKEHRRQIAAIIEVNTKEKEVLLQKMTASANDADKAKKTVVELEQIKKHSADLRMELNDVKFHCRVANNELRDAKQQLQMYKDHFAEKVSQVDDRYAQQINALMMDNQAIRQQYLKKCAELYTIKSERNTKQEDDLVTAKVVMTELIRVRALADVSLVTSFTSDDSTGKNVSFAQTHADGASKSSKNKGILRPSSAPSTPKETKQAVRDTMKEYSAIPSEYAKKMPRTSSSKSFSSNASTLMSLPQEDIHQRTPGSKRKVASAKLLSLR